VKVGLDGHKEQNIPFPHQHLNQPLASHYTNPLNAELNPICHLPTLLRAHHIPRVSRIRVNSRFLQSTKVGDASIAIMMMETTSLTKIHQEAHNL
jgi:hypothetical protein